MRMKRCVHRLISLFSTDAVARDFRLFCAVSKPIQRVRHLILCCEPTRVRQLGATLEPTHYERKPACVGSGSHNQSELTHAL